MPSAPRKKSTRGWEPHESKKGLAMHWWWECKWTWKAPVLVTINLSVLIVQHIPTYFFKTKLCMPGISICIVVRALKFRYDPTDMMWDTRAPSLRTTRLENPRCEKPTTLYGAFRCAEPHFAPPRLHCWHRLAPGPRNRWALPIATAPKLSTYVVFSTAPGRDSQVLSQVALCDAVQASSVWSS